MKAEEYLKQPYTRILIADQEGGYSAEILEFPGCFAQGDSPDETMRNLDEAAVSWIEACQEQGSEIPEPNMNQGYGGKIALRLPRSLHRQAVRLAERDNVSLNQFLVSAIAAKVGADEFYYRVMKEFQARMDTSVQIFMNNYAINMNTIQLRGGNNIYGFDSSMGSAPVYLVSQPGEEVSRHG